MYRFSIIIIIVEIEVANPRRHPALNTQEMALQKIEIDRMDAIVKEVGNSEMHQKVVPPKAGRKKRRTWKRWGVLAVLLLAVAAFFILGLQGKQPIEITIEKADVRDIT